MRDNAIKDTLDLGSIKDVTKGKGVSPGIYTWHHVDAQGNMQLVDHRIHQLFLHKGGIKEIMDLQK